MQAAPAMVLVHSPLVGPLTWQPVADRLRAAGHRIVVPSLAGLLDAGPPYYTRLAEAVARTVRESGASGPLTLVAHSGAGALLPVIGEATGPSVGAAVFVDAILPHPGTSWFDGAPKVVGDRLRGLARDGRLPPWDEWFPAEALVAELPGEDLRARFVSELPRVPLDYLAEPAPAVTGWPPARCGYLQLSSAYRIAADEASRRGWLTWRKAASHLSMVTRPEAVASLLLRVVAQLADG